MKTCFLTKSGVTVSPDTAEKFLWSLGQPYQIGAHVLHTTPSIGLAIYPDDGEDAESLLKDADVAMYHAKSQRRNNVQFFYHNHEQEATERLRMDHELRVALDIHR